MAEGEITLVVTDLDRAETFYRAILAPLGLGFISRVTHQLYDRTTREVTFGLVNVQRVDLRISQCDSAHATIRQRRPRVFFNVNETLTVREFYQAASRYDVQLELPPSTQGSRFTAVVRDYDGNQIRTICNSLLSPGDRYDHGLATLRSDAQPSSPERQTDTMQAQQASPMLFEESRPILQWQQKVANSIGNAAPASSGHTSTVTTRGPPQDGSRTPGPSRHPVSRTMFERSQTPPSRPGSPCDNCHVKNIIAGAAVVGAAGALAYGVYKEVIDSREREDEDRRLRERRNALEDEARAQAHASNGSAKAADRDSGYCSIETEETIKIRKRKTTPSPKSSIHREGSASIRKGPERGNTYPQQATKSRHSSSAPARPIEMIEAPTRSRSTRRSTLPAISEKRSHVSATQAPFDRREQLLLDAPQSHRNSDIATPHTAKARAPSRSSDSTVRQNRRDVSVAEKEASRRSCRAPSKAPSKAVSQASDRTAHYAPLPASSVGTTSTLRHARAKPLPATRTHSQSSGTSSDRASVAPSDSASQVSFKKNEGRVSTRG